MNRNYHISDYCILRNRQVIHDGRVVFENREDNPASFFTSVYKHFEMNYSKFYKMDNLCKLGFLCAELLLKEGHLQRLYPSVESGIILFNAASSLDTDRNHQQTISNRSDYFPSPSVFVYTLANIVIGEICIRHKLFGEGTFLIEENFNPSRMFSYVSRLLDDGIVKYCLTGWIEIDRDQYDGFMVLVEKTAPDPGRIAIFDPGTLKKLHADKLTYGPTDCQIKNRDYRGAEPK